MNERLTPSAVLDQYPQVLSEVIIIMLCLLVCRGTWGQEGKEQLARKQVCVREMCCQKSTTLVLLVFLIEVRSLNIWA